MTTTEDRVATNHRALMAAAAKLERAGFTGDSYRFVEGLVVNLLADGWRPVEPAPALRGPTSTEAGRRAAREIFEQTRREKGNH
ncbi:MAG TPA: hypothetical protein VFV01_17085 [Spirillospora sp.]|nr:hypothetical protein [Spirillospora sp.]